MHNEWLQKEPFSSFYLNDMHNFKFANVTIWFNSKDIFYFEKIIL